MSEARLQPAALPRSTYRTDKMIHALSGPKNIVMNTVHYFRDPYGTILRNARCYGDPFLWPVFPGKMVVTGNPESVRTVFTADTNTFRVLNAERLAPVIGESNLILLSGERHRAMRKLQTPPFHGARLRAYGQAIFEIVQEEAGRWPSDRPFCMHRSALAISMQVILRAVLGLEEAGMRQAFRDAVARMMLALKPTFLFFPMFRRELLGLSGWSRYQRAKRRVKALFDEELRRRRADPRPREDILSKLMEARHADGTGLDDADLLIQTLNLLVAAHESTAAGIAWACALVHRHPEVRARLLDELGGGAQPFDADAVTRLPYLEAVCNETLRLFPVAPLFARQLARPLAIDGHELQPGMAVGISAVLVHQREDLYAEPQRFWPERFLERSYSPFEYLPFGGGARRCVGAAFALYEMKIALAAIVKNHPLHLLHEGPLRPAVRNTTVGPRGGVRMMRAA